MTVKMNDTANVDVTRAMREDLNSFIAALDFTGKKLNYANHVYTHPEGRPEGGTNAVICCVACPSSDAALELHAKIEHLITTFLSPGRVRADGEDTRPIQ